MLGFRFGVLQATSLIAISVMSVQPVWAQTTADQKPAVDKGGTKPVPPVVEPATPAQSGVDVSSVRQDSEIVVTGFRKSLEDALNIKRENSGVVDAISAEDIGKSTDQNIAEAMQRVTGVSIDRTDGEGTGVTIRGAGPSLNNIKLNGITLTSSGGDQGVDFSQFSSDILQSIRINKTASADQDEGSLGGTVELETFKPLAAKRNRRVIEVQARYNSFAENKGKYLDDFGDYRLNLSLSQKFFNDTLGVSLVATREKNTLRRDTYNATWFTPNTYDAATNIETGQIITSYDYDGDGAISSNEQGVRGREVRQNTYSYYRNSRDRDSVTGTIQWRPTSTTDVYFDGTYSTQNIQYDESRVEVLPAAPVNRGRPDLLLWDPATFTFVQDIFQQRFSRTTAPDGNLRVPATIRMYRREAGSTTNNYVLSGGIKQIFGNLTLNLKGGRSLTTVNVDYDRLGRAFVPRTANLSYNPGTVFPSTAAGQAAADAAIAANPGTIPGTNNAFYYSGFTCVPNPQICQMVLNPGLVDDASKFQPQVVSVDTGRGRDEASSAYFDADWDVDFGPIVRLSAGGKWEHRKKENDGTSTAFNNASFGGALRTLTLAPYTAGTTPEWGKKLGFARDDITDGWFVWDLAKTLTDLQASTGTTLPTTTIDLRGTNSVSQTVYAGYVKADFEAFDRRLYGNFGLRYANTSVSANGVSGMLLEQRDFFTPENIAYFGSLSAAIQALGLNTDNDSVHDNGGRFPVGVSPVTAFNKYDDWLPSVNLNWAVTDRLIARAAFSKTIARPPINLLQPNFTVSEVLTTGDSTGSLGGTTLRPFRSTNFDFSVEWYFAKNSLLSVAVYNKKLKDFVERAQVAYYYRDLRDQLFVQDPTNPLFLVTRESAGLPVDFVLTPESVLLPESGGDQQAGCMVNREINLATPNQTPGPGAGFLTQCDSLLITQSRNGQGGYVRGIEAQFQHNFTWLPGVLGGLGVTANVTYADSFTDAVTVFDENGNPAGLSPALPLLGTSKFTYNGTLFYERNGILLRVAYNKRSDYLIDRNVRDGNAHWIQGYDTLDVSGSFRVTRNFTINFQAQNLLDTVTRTYSTSVIDTAGLLPAEGSAFGKGVTKDRTVALSNTGPIFRLGARLTF